MTISLRVVLVCILNVCKHEIERFSFIQPIFFSLVYHKNIFSHKSLKLNNILHIYSNLGVHLLEQILFDQ